MVMLILLFFSLNICASLSANIWLSKWTDKVKNNNQTNGTTSQNSQIFYMNIYSTLGIIQGIQ